MQNPKTSNGDWTDYGTALPDVRLTEPNPFERFRIAMGDGPAEMRRKNRAAMEAMVEVVG